MSTPEGNSVELFQNAAEYMRKPHVKLNQQEQLKLYALFKQATVGPCNTTRPGMFDLVGRAKWDAWKAVPADLSPDDARIQYIEVVKTICPTWSPAAPTPAPPRPNGDAPQEANDDELDEEFNIKGTAGGGGGGGGMGPSVSTFMIQEEDGVGCGESDLCYLASENRCDQIKSLLEARGCDVNFQDGEGQTALHFAADRQHLSLLQILLEYKANVNLQTTDGQTALHYAAAAGQREAICALLDAGADRGILDEDGATACDCADDDDLRKLLGA